ncbi:MAG: family lipolytic protein [Phycisphaerales bacterium]|nr:family lipolytic protein [Phycisphaerales bacterium]
MQRVAAVLIAFCLIAGFDGLCRAEDAKLEKLPPAVFQRTAFLGDSITDGNTYPQLVRDALIGVGREKMIAINAGIGGDTAHGMRGRLDRDVLAFHPTLVTLSCGANDTLHGVSPESYEQDVRAIAGRMKREHIPLILLTPNVLGPKQQAKGQKGLVQYEAILRQIARDYDLRVAEVNARQKEDAAAGRVQLAPDDLHPNWNGQRMIARAVLDAMGYPEVKVPDRIVNEPLPGVVGEWKVKPLEADAPPVTDEMVKGMKADGAWLTLKLPESQPIPDADSLDERWLDHYRTLGASVSLRQRPQKRFIGIATIASDKARVAQFHTGAELEDVWLNGKHVYHNDGSRGWHIGRESFAGELKAGENSLVIRTGQVFFLSVTEGPIYP